MFSAPCRLKIPRAYKLCVGTIFSPSPKVKPRSLQRDPASLAPHRLAFAGVQMGVRSMKALGPSGGIYHCLVNKVKSDDMAPQLGQYPL